MNKLLFILLIFSIILLFTRSCQQEGFNTYFRQRVRPHVRNIKDAHETVTYHFNNKFKNFSKTLGFN